MRKITKTITTAFLAGILSAGLILPAAADETAAVRVGALSGPTAMGMVKLMDEAENGKTQNTYEFADFSADPSTFVAPLAKGEIDIAAVPSNLASVIYNNTEGGVVVLGIIVDSVLNIVERGEEISSIADLKGKEMYATGQGAVPEYTLRYLLGQNEIDPDEDVTIHWCADTTEALAYISEDENAIAMLPQPFVTAACAQVEGLRPAFTLADEWEKLDNGTQIVTGVLVARKAFVEEHPEELDVFMEEYASSAAYAQEDIEGAAALIVKYGIIAKEPLAQKALPNCSVTFRTGEEMKEALSAYLSILFDANPKAVGGNLPGEDFYLGSR